MRTWTAWLEYVIKLHGSVSVERATNLYRTLEVWQGGIFILPHSSFTISHTYQLTKIGKYTRVIKVFRGYDTLTEAEVTCKQTNKHVQFS